MNQETVKPVNLSENLKKPKRPFQLLPIPHPLDYEPEEALFFYNNVVQPLIRDILRMESQGIPINLDKVHELNKQVDSILLDIRTKLKDNSVMLEFLQHEANLTKNKKAEILTLKRRTAEAFFKPYDPKNKVHRSYVVNRWLFNTNRTDMQLEEWSIKDLKKAIQLTASNFLQQVLDKTIDPESVIVKAAMQLLAQHKADAFNKNVDDKVDSLDEADLIEAFNPGSALQKQKFFTFFDIESEKTTDGGAPQWNRDEIERVQQMLQELINNHVHTNNSTE